MSKKNAIQSNSIVFNNEHLGTNSMVSEKTGNSLNIFFKEEYQSLKGYVRSKINDTVERDAEDIVQDVALKIFSRPADAVPIDNIGGFVYSAIRNRIVDIMRIKEQRIDQNDRVDDLWQEFAALFYSPDQNSYPEAIKKTLKKAISELKPIYRDIIIAVDFEGYTYREIALETGISPGTLMSRRHRALSILLRKLELKKNINSKTYGT